MHYRFYYVAMAKVVPSSIFKYHICTYNLNYFFAVFEGFRMRYDTFHEQPDVRFTGEYLFIGYTNNISFPIICSNIYWEVNNQDNCILIQVK